MMQFTDLADSPWYTVESEDKKASRLNVIAHLLSTVPYEALNPKPVEIPRRPDAVGYARPPRESNRYVPDHAHSLEIVQPKVKKKKPKADKPEKPELTDQAVAETAEQEAVVVDVVTEAPAAAPKPAPRSTKGRTTE